jgi:hypothetical protein
MMAFRTLQKGRVQEAKVGSPRTTVERGTETMKAVVSKAGESGIHDLQVSLNEVDFLVKAAQLAASTIVHLDPTEVFLRKLSSMSVAQVDLQSRAASTFSAKPLRCVELTGSGFRRLSCDNRISTEKPYRTTHLWSRALFLHPQQPDGLVSRNRHDPRFRCLALFDRCDAKLTEARSEPLMDPPRRAWCSVQLDRYELAMT